MKSKSLIILSCIFLAMSCSKKDEPTVPAVNNNVPTVGDEIVTTFVSTIATQSWTYATTKEIILPLPTSNTNGTDILTVGNDYFSNGFTYKTMTTSANPTGFYCSMLKDNYIRVDGSSVKMSGKFKFNLGANLLEFPVNDFVIFKENATTGTNLGEPATGSIDLAIPNFSTPVKVNYTIKALAGGDSTPIVINSITYNDIKKIILYISIDAGLNLPPLGVTQVLQPSTQDVIVSTQYYSKNIGLVKADTQIEYKLNSSIISLIPTIPANGNQNITDNLSSKNF